jgi:hypothetical protein
MGWNISMVITDSMVESDFDTALHFHERTSDTTSFDMATRLGSRDNLGVGKIGEWWHVVTRNGDHFMETAGTISNYGGKTIAILVNSSGCVWAFFEYHDSVMTTGWIEADGDTDVIVGDPPYADDLETYLLEHWKKLTGITDKDVSDLVLTVFRPREP